MIININALKENYSNYSNVLDKIRRENLSNVIIRIKKGLYETNRNVEPYFLAGSIIAPSYLSFEWALSYYGLIPERVITITSASLNKRKRIWVKNKFGSYKYNDIPLEAFIESVILMENDYSVKIATKEKALCDCLYIWPPVYSVKSLKELLFLDKRIDENDFCNLDFKQLLFLSKLYKKRNFKFLEKLIRKEYLHE